jgi:hypothetical protein
LRRKAGFTFTFLSDPNLDVIRRYDLLHAAAGPDGHDISRPAEFLVDRSGTVRWENFTEDIRVRPRAQEMLAAARDIQELLVANGGDRHIVGDKSSQKQMYEKPTFRPSETASVNTCAFLGTNATDEPITPACP